MSTVDNDLEEIRKSALNIVTTLESEVVKNRYVINALANVLNEGLILLDSNGFIIVMNSIASNILAIKDSLGKHVSTVIPEIESIAIEHIVEHKEVTLLDIETGMPKYLEILMSKLDGVQLEIKTSETPAILITIRDVTYKKAREYRVSDITSFHSNIIEALPIPTFYTDKDGGALRGSAAFFEMFRLDKLRALSVNIRTLLPKSAATRFLSDNENKYLTSVVIKTADRERHVLLYRNILKDESDRIIGYLGCLVDSSYFSIDPMSEILIKSLTQYSDPLVIVSYFSKKPFLVSNSFTQEFGYSIIDLSNNGFKKLVHHADETKVKKAIVKSKISLLPNIVGPILVVHKDGTTSQELIHILPITRSFSTKFEYFLLIFDHSKFLERKE